MSSNREFVERYLRKYYKDLIESHKRALARATREATLVYFRSLDAEVKRIFDSEVENYYSDYTPIYYKNSGGRPGISQRRFSMKELYRSEINEENVSLKIDFESSKMKYRNASSYSDDYEPGDLYDMAFRKGWHGGADHMEQKVKFTEPHPNPGTPYWRTPPFTYSNWGRPATRTTPSPLKAIQSRVANLDYTPLNDEYNRNLNRLFHEYAKQER